MRVEKYLAPEKNFATENYNFVFIMVVILFLGLGFTVLYSGSLSYGARFFDDPLYFVKRQAVNFVFGLFGLVASSFISEKKLRQFLPFILIFSFVFMLMPFIPGFRSARHNAYRWVKIFKVIFQPSEFIKITIVLFLANFFDKKQDKLDEPLISVFPPFIVCGIFIFLTYLQPDFSTAMFLAFLAGLMFFVAGVRLSWFLKGLICFIPLATIMILSKAYRLERVLAFLFPEHDPLGGSFQVNAALRAISSGGLWGKGLGAGVLKISSVPEIYSDFIFVVWAEEMGYIGVFAYFLLLVAFAFLGFKIAIKNKNRFFKYLAFGSTASIVFQSILNATVVSRLVPATGIPMPFFSYGGSSLISTMCFCGLIINASKQRAGETDV